MELSWKKYPFVICKLLGMVVNILTADDKYTLLNRISFRQPIQMQLSEKERGFSPFVSAFMKSRLSFEYFQKN